MYGKIFETVFTGSLYGSGPTVFAVWSYVIATAKPPGVCELNPKLLAGCIGTTVEDVRAAIILLTADDPDSRNSDEEGRRLVHLGAFQYRVVSFDKYRLMVTVEDKRDADRKRIADKRSKQSIKGEPITDSCDISRATSQDVSGCRNTSQDVACSSDPSPDVANVAYTDTYTYKEEEIKKKTYAPLRVADLVALGVDRQVADDFFAIRKAKRQPLTPTALDAIAREAEKAGMTLESALRESASRSWAGFRAKWLASEARPLGKQSALEARNSAAVAEWLSQGSSDAATAQ